MAPTLREGDFVVAARWLKRPRVRQLVVVHHRVFGVMVKRLAVRADDGYWLESDNAGGLTTSRMGKVSADQIIGRVLFAVRRSWKT
jgi:hypothetical protein